MWEKELEASIAVAIEAGRAIMDVYEKSENVLEVEYKSDSSPLTKADRASNDMIVAALRQSFPDHAILSEEEKDDKKRLDNKLCFVVDPLDGTKEFIKRNGQFTVNIALSNDHVSEMGVIYVPVTKELYYASKGNGAFYKKEGEEPERIHVSDNKEISELKVVMSSSHGCKEMDDLIEKYSLKNFVKMGSSLKGCLVASGKADVYFRHNPTMEWDTAAMQCIVEEAGGIFRQMDDSPMRYNRENSLNDKGFYAINCIENRLG
ncbi:MAG: 3'(2'),5'-bisphosphate nucleotidase CysQ [Lachnospiraceae bacterium]|nr:3'(2'),5'-bisphosphate nucleotidase CysQ [Lachnospiraceae bacterium]